MSQTRPAVKPDFPRPMSALPDDSPQAVYAVAISRLDALRARIATCTPRELPHLRAAIVRAKFFAGLAYRRTRSAR